MYSNNNNSAHSGLSTVKKPRCEKEYHQINFNMYSPKKENQNENTNSLERSEEFMVKRIPFHLYSPKARLSNSDETNELLSENVSPQDQLAQDHKHIGQFSDFDVQSQNNKNYDFEFIREIANK